MGARYGVGLLGYLPEMDGDGQNDAMRRFAKECGPAVAFCEVIGTRVAEWIPPGSAKGSYAMRWLEADEAGPILEFARQERHSAPYSQFGFLDGWQLFIPGPWRSRKPIGLSLPGQEPRSLKVNTLKEGISGIQAINRKIEKYDEEFWQGEQYSCKEYTTASKKR